MARLHVIEAGRLVIGVSGDETTLDRVEQLALVYIVRIEKIDSDTKRQAG